MGSGPQPALDAGRRRLDKPVSDDPTAWFEELYVAAGAGEAEVPWERQEPNPRLVSWARDEAIDGTGKRALVVGSGLGMDAEYVAGLGFDTTAFDVAPTAIRTSQERFPESRVRYLVADLLDPPSEWREAFDFVLESITVQALPPGFHAETTARVTEFVAPGGTLLVLSAAREDHEDPDGPPWPLTRAEIEAFEQGGLETVRIEEIDDASRGESFPHRWRAEFRRVEPGVTSVG
jgi:Thiopurine S-methyltransferase (TPMT)